MSAKKFRVGDVVRIKADEFKEAVANNGFDKAEVKAIRAAKYLCLMREHDDGNNFTCVVRCGKTGRGRELYFTARELELVSRPTK